MNDIHETITPITRTLIPEEQRMAHTAQLFGAHFPLVIEPVVYGITERMAEAYSGGYWQFWRLDNGTFYMSPEGDRIYLIRCDNGWSGELSPDALGITACLYAYSHCSFSRDEAFGQTCAQHYHRLRDYMADHAEVASILRATD